MIYPESFEHKIGFDEIRTMLKGRCLSSLGTEWIDRELHFMSSYDEVTGALARAADYARFMAECDDEVESEFFDVREALLRVRPERTYMEENDLYSLKRSMQSVCSYCALFQKSNDIESDPAEHIDTPTEPDYLYPALQTMTTGISSFPQLVQRIDAVLNKYGRVKDTASPQLLSIRHQLETTVRSISHSLRTIVTEAQAAGYIDKDVKPTLRDGRLMIPVPQSTKKKIKGIVHDESATGKTVFIEPSAVVEANNHIRELQAAEKREIISILQELTAAIRPYIPEIGRSLVFLGQVDWLRALTLFSQSVKAVIPQVEDAPRLDWNKARHPVLELSLARHGNKIIPLDVSLRQGQRILLISGPNAGGKSVCLKTVGLLQYMLQCGMPVPAGESSVAGIFSDIFIDIGDEQSLEDDLSTYSSHLLNMKMMMRHAGDGSLLLIDEFGGGTDPLIGGALAQAMLDRFVKIKTWGIITTHYQNLKHFASATPGLVNGAMLYDRADMKPLFMLQVGNPGSSFAVEIARKIGIPEEVIKYASDIVGQDYIMSDKYLQDIVRDKIYWENKRRNIRQREKQLETTVESYEREMTDFQQQRRDILAQAKEEARHILEQTNAKIENTIRTIKEAQAEKQRTKEVRADLAEFKERIEQTKDEEERLARKIAQIQRRRQRKQNDGVSRKQLNAEQQALAAAKLRTGTVAERAVAQQTAGAVPKGSFEKGQYVRLKGQTSVGKIESVSGSTAKVLFGMMFTQVPLKRLEYAERPQQDSVTQASTFVSRQMRDAMYEKKLQFRPELDIRGMHVDEALTAVSYFIDDAIQLEQGSVRILHGTGTGALRELVRNYLTTVPGVRAFHDEHVQFGGAGITVVELK